MTNSIVNLELNVKPSMQPVKSVRALELKNKFIEMMLILQL